MKVSINIPEPEKAYIMLRNNISMLNWAEKNNRPYQMNFYKNLNEPIINQMIEDRQLLEDKNFAEFNKKYSKTFIDEIYPKCNYDDIYNSILDNINIIEQVLPRFKALYNSWGFKLFEVYNINLDFFAPGGMYNSKEGYVKIGINAGNIDIKKNLNRLIFTIIHEMVHLGIQEYIVEKYNLPQEEKERIVDNLCIYVTEGIIDSKLKIDKDGNPTSYQPVAQCAAYMDNIVGKQPETNLDKAIAAFIQDKSIKRYHI